MTGKRGLLHLMNAHEVVNGRDENFGRKNVVHQLHADRGQFQDKGFLLRPELREKAMIGDETDANAVNKNEGWVCWGNGFIGGEGSMPITEIAACVMGKPVETKSQAGARAQRPDAEIKQQRAVARLDGIERETGTANHRIAPGPKGVMKSRFEFAQVVDETLSFVAREQFRQGAVQRPGNPFADVFTPNVFKFGIEKPLAKKPLSFLVTLIFQKAEDAFKNVVAFAFGEMRRRRVFLKGSKTELVKQVKECLNDETSEQNALQVQHLTF